MRKVIESTIRARLLHLLCQKYVWQPFGSKNLHHWGHLSILRLGATPNHLDFIMFNVEPMNILYWRFSSGTRSAVPKKWIVPEELILRNQRFGGTLIKRNANTHPFALAKLVQSPTMSPWYYMYIIKVMICHIISSLVLHQFIYVFPVVFKVAVGQIPIPNPSNPRLPQ
jgi:hypothetical protein